MLPSFSAMLADTWKHLQELGLCDFTISLPSLGHNFHR